MNEQNQQRCTAFLRQVANNCDGCYRGNLERCRTCAATVAKNILRAIASETVVAPVDYSLAARMDIILAALGKASPEPLFAYQIDLANLCTAQLKRWTLHHMIHLGFVGQRLHHKKKSGYSVYRYFLTPKGIQKWQTQQSTPPKA